MFQKTDYIYELPAELIAEKAAQPHHDARLMVVDRTSGDIVSESTFWHLDEFLGEDRVIFFNNSRVLRARVALRNTPYTDTRGEKKILDEGEIFYLKTTESGTFEALVRPGNRFKVGNTFTIGEFTLEVLGMTETGRVLKILQKSEIFFGGDDKSKTGVRTGWPVGTKIITDRKEEQSEEKGVGLPLETFDTFGHKSMENSVGNLLAQYGALPLPPYIEYSKEKEKDYQTAFAEKDGSVAAPTASLHFTEELLAKIANEKKYVTLHVGLGTFKGIDTGDIREYVIHSESIEITRDTLVDIATVKLSGKKIVAVGTTACRTLESLPSLWKNLDESLKNQFDANIRDYWNRLSENISTNTWIANLVCDVDTGTIRFDTSIYITPGYEFLVVDDLVTNFHLPESSLLVLVSAFIGHTESMKLYEQAIQKKYRFYSFGDGMYIRGK